MTTITQTITTTYAQFQNPVPVTPSSSQGSRTQASGSSLGSLLSSTSSSSTTTLCADEEGVICSNFEALLNEGYSLRVEELIKEMSSTSFLASDMYQTITSISQAFIEIDLNDWEGQADAIAILLFRIIIPAFKTANPRERLILAHWEKACRDIITLILPAEEDVNIFIEVSEFILREEDLARDTLKKNNEVAEVIFNTIGSVAKKIDQKMNSDTISAQQQMMAHQIKIEEDLTTATSGINNVNQEISQSSSELLNRAIANQSIGSTIEEKNNNFNSTAQQYKTLLSGVSKKIS